MKLIKNRFFLEKMINSGNCIYIISERIFNTIHYTRIFLYDINICFDSRYGSIILMHIVGQCMTYTYIEVFLLIVIDQRKYESVAHRRINKISHCTFKLFLNVAIRKSIYCRSHYILNCRLYSFGIKLSEGYFGGINKISHCTFKLFLKVACRFIVVFIIFFNYRLYA